MTDVFIPLNQTHDPTARRQVDLPVVHILACGSHLLASSGRASIPAL